MLSLNDENNTVGSLICLIKSKDSEGIKKFLKNKDNKSVINNSYNTYSNYQSNYYTTPIGEAIKNNYFEIADILLKNGADINTVKSEILNNNKKHGYRMINDFDKKINGKNLKYLLEHNYKINNLERTIDNIIKSNKKSTNSLFETFLKYYCSDSEGIEKCYDKILNKNNFRNNSINYRFISILLRYEISLNNSTNNDKCNNHSDKMYLYKLLKLIKYDIYIEYKEYLTTRRMLNDIEKEILKFFNTIETFLNNILLNKDVTTCKKYIDDNHILLEELNSKEFDILIYAIENKVSNEMIKFILNQSFYTDLNYKINPVYTNKSINNNTSKSYRKFHYEIYSDSDIRDEFQFDEYPVTNSKYHSNEYSNSDSEYYSDEYDRANDKNRNENTNNYYYKPFQHETNISPIYCAIINNNFELANILLCKGSDFGTYEDDTLFEFYFFGEEILYNKLNIIEKLFNDNMLNKENLSFILDIKFFKIHDVIIFKWIKAFNNLFLDIYFNYGKNYNNIKIEFYYCAIEYNNFNALLILYHHDKNEKNDIFKQLLHIYNYIEIKERSNHCFKYKNDSWVIYSETSKNYKWCPENNQKYVKLKDELMDNIYKIKSIINKRIILMNELTPCNDNGEPIDLLNLSEEELSYRSKNEILDDNDINNENFDILIYAIDNDASNEKIKKIITDYKKQNKSFNYYIKFIKSIFEEKLGFTESCFFRITYDYKAPLFSAVSHGKYEIANLLIELGADINFAFDKNEKKKENIDILKYIIQVRRLYLDNFKYILSKGYIIDNLINYKDDIIKYLLEVSFRISFIAGDSYFIDHLKILSYYLDYLYEKRKKNIIDSIIYYEISIRNKFYKAIPLLFYYDHQDNDKTIRLYIIYFLFCIYAEKGRTYHINDFKKIVLNGTDNDNYNDYEYYQDDNNSNDEHFDDNIDDNDDSKEIKLFKEECNKLKIKMNTNNKNEIFDKIKACKDLSELEIYLNKNRNSIELAPINWNLMMPNCLNKNKDSFNMTSLNWDLLMRAIYNDVPLNNLNVLMKMYNNLNYYTTILRYKYICNTYYDYEYKRRDTEIVELYNTPLLAAIKKNKFEVADLLIKNGANINYHMEVKEPFFIYKEGFFNQDNLNYMMKKGYGKPDKLIKYCILSMRNSERSEKEDYIKKIFNYYSFDPSYIINFILKYKNKSITKKDLNKIISDGYNKIFSNEIIALARNQNDKDIIDIINNLI